MRLEDPSASVLLAPPAPPALPAPRQAILALALLVPAPTIGVLLALWWFPDSGGRYGWMLSKLHLLAFPALWWRLCERRPWSLSPARHGGFGLGIASGLALGAVVLGGYFWVGQDLVEPDLLRGLLAKNSVDTPSRFLGLALYLSLVNALTEEYVWRWFVMRQWRALATTRAAVLLTALCFALHHFVAVYAYLSLGVALLAATGTIVGSIVWSGLYLRTGSIWPAYVSHVLVDFAVFAVGWQILFA